LPTNEDLSDIMCFYKVTQCNSHHCGKVISFNVICCQDMGYGERLRAHERTPSNTSSFTAGRCAACHLADARKALWYKLGHDTIK
jgi:hypothetical protein